MFNTYQHKSSGPVSRAIANATAGNGGIGMPAVPVLKKTAGVIDETAISAHAPIQRTLNIETKDITEDQLSDVELLILVDHVEEHFNESKDITDDDSTDYDEALKIYAELSAVHSSVPAMLENLKKLVNDTNPHDFDTWEDAALTVYKQDQQRKRKRLGKQRPRHVPSPPGSPYNSDQEEMISHLNTRGRAAEHMKPEATYNELKVHGQLGEYSHQQLLTQQGVEHFDGNEAFGYNVPGIDTLINDAMPFGQSKMHLGSVESAQELVRSYTQHIDNAPAYAKKFLKYLFSENKSGIAVRQKLLEINKVWKNPTLKRLSEMAESEEWRGASVQDLESSDVGGRIEHVEPVELVTQGMIFPVPYDVYEQIPGAYLPWFEQLPFTLYDYRKVKSGMVFNYRGEAQKAEKKDDDYKPRKPKRKKRRVKEDSDDDSA